MDSGPFDFELDDIVRLLSEMPGLAASVTIEPRVHDADEAMPPHTGATFRISCQLVGGYGVVRHLAELETRAGVETVLEPDGTVRFRRGPKTS
jgi:hypothetical protein